MNAPTDVLSRVDTAFANGVTAGQFVSEAIAAWAIRLQVKPSTAARLIGWYLTADEKSPVWETIVELDEVWNLPADRDDEVVASLVERGA